MTNTNAPIEPKLTDQEGDTTATAKNYPLTLKEGYTQEHLLEAARKDDGENEDDLTLVNYLDASGLTNQIFKLLKKWDWKVEAKTIELVAKSLSKKIAKEDVPSPLGYLYKGLRFANLSVEKSAKSDSKKFSASEQSEKILDYFGCSSPKPGEQSIDQKEEENEKQIASYRKLLDDYLAELREVNNYLYELITCKHKMENFDHKRKDLEFRLQDMLNRPIMDMIRKVNAEVVKEPTDEEKLGELKRSYNDLAEQESDNALTMSQLVDYLDLYIETQKQWKSIVTEMLKNDSIPQDIRNQNETIKDVIELVKSNYHTANTRMKRILRERYKEK